jgi:hypothetical protein
MDNRRIGRIQTLDFLEERERKTIPGALLTLRIHKGERGASPVVDLWQSSIDSRLFAPCKPNLFGRVSGKSAVMFIGAATASSVPTVVNREPTCTEAGHIAGKTANNGVLPPIASNTFTQSFDVITADPMIGKPGKVRP